MIQGIQNVSFNGAKSTLLNKAVRKAEEAYVSASSNLTGTVNAAKAERQLRDAKFFVDNDTLAGRIGSMKAAKQPMDLGAAPKAAEIIPENSINFIC